MKLVKDLAQCTVSREDFQRWLDLGHAPITVCLGEKAAIALTQLEKSPSVNYLYQTVIEENNGISWTNSLTFCGVYDRKSRALYLTDDSLSCLTEGRYPLAEELIPSMAEEICGKINQYVEDIISNDRNNLSVQELTDQWNLYDLQHYQKHGAREDAIECFFKSSEPDVRFHSGYKLDELSETGFMAYLQVPEYFIQTEAEQYIRSQQEKFLLDFLKNDALLAEYQTLTQDTDSPIYQMRAITDAVEGCGAKTVRVTVLRGNKELTFRTDADSLKGYQEHYSTFGIPVSDLRAFETVFGQFVQYTVMDIAKITYGRDTIYEAPSMQEKEMMHEFKMGGM